MKITKIVAGLTLASCLIGAAPAANAGCLGGAVVGGVAGHVAGHHAVLGAVGGCVVGHHMAVVKKRQRMAARQAAMQGNPPPHR